MVSMGVRRASAGAEGRAGQGRALPPAPGSGHLGPSHFLRLSFLTCQKEADGEAASSETFPLHGMHLGSGGRSGEFQLLMNQQHTSKT